MQARVPFQPVRSSAPPGRSRPEFAFRVRRQLRCNFARARRINRLLALTYALMQPAATRESHTLIEDVLIKSVNEAEAGCGCAGLPLVDQDGIQELTVACQSLAMLLNLHNILGERCGHIGGRKHRSRYARCVEQSLFL